MLPTIGACLVQQADQGQIKAEDSLWTSPEGVSSSVKDNCKVCWWRLQLQQVKHSSHKGKQDAGVLPCLGIQAHILPPKVGPIQQRKGVQQNEPAAKI